MEVYGWGDLSFLGVDKSAMGLASSSEDEADSGVDVMESEGRVSSTATHVLFPTRLPQLEALGLLVDVHVGDGFLLALTEPGEMFVWGSGTYGQLGLGPSVTNVSTPTRVRLSSSSTATHDEAIFEIAVGTDHCLAVTRSGHLFAWGLGDRGQLGLGSVKSVNRPTLLKSVADKEFAHVAATSTRSLALTMSGCVYVWGMSEVGALGLGSAVWQLTPKFLPDLMTTPVRRVSASPDVSCFISDDGEMFFCGYSTVGQFGCGDRKRASRPRPVSVAVALEEGEVTAEEMDGGTIAHRILQVALGSLFTLVLTEDGSVFAAGLNSHGQLGTDAMPACHDFVPVTFASRPTSKIVEIAAGSAWAAARTEDGHLYTWGAGSHGQLGIGLFADAASPTFLGVLLGKRVEAVRAGSASAFAFVEASEATEIHSIFGNYSSAHY